MADIEWLSEAVTDAVGERPTEFATTNLSVRFYRRDPDRVVVVFASAGSRRVEGFSEEFHGTLRHFGVSIIFVTDRNIRWYNYSETAEVLRRVADMVAPFAHVGVLGESLGGSGALLFTNFACNVSRALALAPQYSVAPPFVKFDERYSPSSEKIDRFYYGAFSDSPVMDRCLLLYGNRSWRDYIHATMFAAAGFTIAFVDDSPHEVSAYLKNSSDTNRLRHLIDAFCDFGSAFGKESAGQRAGIEWSASGLKGAHFSDVMGKEVRFKDMTRHRIPLPPETFELISLGRKATQSSLSTAARGKTVEEDAAGAVNGKPTGGYGFHTANEERPWWKVDLGKTFLIQEIRLFNRINNIYIAERAYKFQILSSFDDQNWNIFYTKDNNEYFGGVDGRPHILMLNYEVHARYIKIQLLTTNSFHLDQVQIFGAFHCVSPLV